MGRPKVQEQRFSYKETALVEYQGSTIPATMSGWSGLKTDSRIATYETV